MKSGVVDGLADQKPNGKTEFQAYLRPTDKSANPLMPRCRTSIPSKDKQRIGARGEGCVGRGWDEEEK